MPSDELIILRKEVERLQQMRSSLMSSAYPGITWRNHAKVWAIFASIFVGGVGVVGVLIEGVSYDYAAMIAVGVSAFALARRAERSQRQAINRLNNVASELESKEQELRALETRERTTI